MFRALHITLVFVMAVGWGGGWGRVRLNTGPWEHWPPCSCAVRGCESSIKGMEHVVPSIEKDAEKQAFVIQNGSDVIS